MIRFTNGSDGVFAHIKHDGKSLGINIEHEAKTSEFFKVLVDKVKKTIEKENKRSSLEHSVMFAVEQSVKNGMCPFEIEAAYEELEQFNKDHPEQP